MSWRNHYRKHKAELNELIINYQTRYEIDPTTGPDRTLWNTLPQQVTERDVAPLEDYGSEGEFRYSDTEADPDEVEGYINGSDDGWIDGNLDELEDEPDVYDMEDQEPHRASGKDRAELTLTADEDLRCHGRSE